MGKTFNIEFYDQSRHNKKIILIAPNIALDSQIEQDEAIINTLNHIESNERKRERESN